MREITRTDTRLKGSSPDPILSNDDEVELARLGYKQELRRAYKPLEVFGLSFSIIGLLPSIASVLVYAVPNGGPIAMVWGWAVCASFIVVVSLALAELGSAAPTSGGLYYWTHAYSSPRWRRLLAWIVGYSNTIGNIGGVASIDWGCAVQLMAAASIGSGQTFTPSVPQTFAVFVAVVICHAVVCSLATHIIARLQGIYIVLNILLCVAIIIALPAATPAEFKNDAAYAFGGFSNFNGWPDGFAFILSFLAPLWTIGGFDAPVHISEEATNASIVVPWAIVGSASLAGILGWGVNVALTFCMGTNLEAIMSSPIEQPMAAIFLNSFGQKGTLAVWSVVVAVQFMMGTSMLTACSRQTFAFSRDGGLPCSRLLYYVSPSTHTPVVCVWASAACALVLGLLAFAGPAAISAVFSIAITGQYIAYSIPIAARFLGGQAWVPGPFSLGRMGLPVAVTALLWMAFAVIIIMFPTAPSPGAPAMNYTVAVMGGVLLLCIMYFYAPIYGGVHWFTGPVTNLEVHLKDGSSADEKSVI